jgi:hypothetical protein
MLFTPSPILHLPSIFLLPSSTTRVLVCSDPHLVGPNRRSALDAGECLPARRRAARARNSSPALAYPVPTSL